MFQAFEREHSSSKFNVINYNAKRYSAQDCSWPGCEPDVIQCYVLVQVTALPAAMATPKSRPAGSQRVSIGMPADDVLAVLGKGTRTEVVGEDENGLIVKWFYPDAVYTMKLWESGGITRYRVANIATR